MNEPKRIVLTGGPCGGKTTALARIVERLESFGYHVLVVPEVATMLITGANLYLPGMTQIQQFRFENELVSLQSDLERTFKKIAKMLDKPTVIIHDRGSMDAAAFVSDEVWQAILDHKNFSLTMMRDTYDCVIHMVSAANGAEEFYTLDNNEARTETPEQAKAIDERIQKVWMGCPHLRVIDNREDFERKIQRVVAVVCDVVGIPEPLETERKFLVNWPEGGLAPALPEDAVRVYIEQVYLATEDGTEARVRRRGGPAGYVYTHTTKLPVNERQRIEKERVIDAREYVEFLQHADPERKRISKDRYCFVYEGQYFELDVFHNHLDGLIVLEVELDAPDQKVTLPPFLDIVKEVTEDKLYSNYELAGRIYPHEDWSSK